MMRLAVACASPLPLLVRGATGRRPAARTPEPVAAQGAWDVRSAPGLGRAVSAAAVAAALLALFAALRTRLRRQRSRRATAPPPPQSEVPASYRAAGVLFYTRSSAGDVSHVLLGVEERKVPLRDLGQGSGSAKRKVLLFPQGKREPYDRGFVDTARREYVEETADPFGVAERLEAAVSSTTPLLPSTWYADAKMAVVFCEVPASCVLAAGDAETVKRAQTPTEELPLRPVWVEAGDVRRALAATSTASRDVKTELGWFPLFPVTRRFLQTAGVLRWLGVAASRGAGRGRRR